MLSKNFGDKFLTKKNLGVPVEGIPGLSQKVN